MGTSGSGSPVIPAASGWPAFSSVLVANRGEIALRVMRTCARMGIRTVAVYSDADARSSFVRAADTAVRLGPSPAAESYLRMDAILGAAATTGAEAIHPGYGFLAENAAFAEAVETAGLVWVGPPAAAMRALGDKARAKALAEANGVPVLPGYHGEAASDEELAARAAGIGFPLLVKASAGGGGRGMRVVRSADALPEALAGARREAAAAFGDDRLLLERYLELPRHVEVQVLGDAHGTLVHLGERECSVQRRHQKLIEESPSPAVSAELREAMGEAALRLTRAAGYRNAGTVEFLLDESGAFFFLEVNARLQVEHPVTEAVTGLDLVEQQLRVAAGEPLGFSQEDVRADGHAMELRIVAEDVGAGFLPATGVVTALDLPAGVRVDTGIATGSVVSPFYDSLVAKVIAHGWDRATRSPACATRWMRRGSRAWRRTSTCSRPCSTSRRSRRVTSIPGSSMRIASSTAGGGAARGGRGGRRGSIPGADDGPGPNAGTGDGPGPNARYRRRPRPRAVRGCRVDRGGMGDPASERGGSPGAASAKR